MKVGVHAGEKHSADIALFRDLRTEGV